MFLCADIDLITLLKKTGRQSRPTLRNRLVSDSEPAGQEQCTIPTSKRSNEQDQNSLVLKISFVF